MADRLGEGDAAQHADATNLGDRGLPLGERVQLGRQVVTDALRVADQIMIEEVAHGGFANRAY